jgi:CheY-like chemotaxis protein/GAF domain-containing protein
LANRPRILVFDSPGLRASEWLERCQADCELVRVESVAEGLARLRAETFDGVLASPQDPAFWQRVGSLLQADYILQVQDEGVALVGPDLRISWANATFEKWSGGPTKGQQFYESLGSPEILGPDYNPFHTALAGKPVTTRLHRHDNHYLELHVTPVADASGKVSQLISLVRDVTAEVQQQQKLDALHQAGRELSALTADQLADMTVEERIELLKYNIRRFTHDLLHYDILEVRLLDRQTGRLEPLLAEGLTAEAATRVLYARPEGNGVTGFVAATGKSYLCPDTATDPLYIEGAKGARSSLTVPLLFGDQVIGTFNVESPQVNAFSEQDLQFAEIFSREIASALNTLELLTAEKRTTASRSVEAISREVALPVDEILGSAAYLLDRWIGHDPEIVDRLRQILAGARAIKQMIYKVGADLAPAGAGLPAEAETHPRLKGMRVLVADNDERVRRSAHNILGRFGLVVETARDGKEALTMARLSTYDAILADIRLPDMTGFEVYQGLRKAQPQARVILMTSYGYDPTHSIVKARQDGLRFVLFKPFRVDQLLDALENPEPAVAAQPAAAVACADK